MNKPDKNSTHTCIYILGIEEIQAKPFKCMRVGTYVHACAEKAERDFVVNSLKKMLSEQVNKCVCVCVMEFSVELKKTSSSSR